jgi:hypothetical protein
MIFMINHDFLTRLIRLAVEKHDDLIMMML